MLDVLGKLRLGLTIGGGVVTGMALSSVGGTIGAGLGTLGSPIGTVIGGALGVFTGAVTGLVVGTIIKKASDYVRYGNASDQYYEESTQVNDNVHQEYDLFLDLSKRAHEKEKVNDQSQTISSFYQDATQRRLADLAWLEAAFENKDQDPASPEYKREHSQIQHDKAKAFEDRRIVVANEWNDRPSLGRSLYSWWLSGSMKPHYQDTEANSEITRQIKNRFELS